MKILKAIGTISFVTIMAFFWKFAIFLAIGGLVTIFIVRKMKSYKNKGNDKWGNYKKW